MRILWASVGQTQGRPRRSGFARAGRLMVTLAVALVLALAIEHLAIWVYSIMFPPGLDAPWDKIAAPKLAALIGNGRTRPTGGISGAA